MASPAKAAPTSPSATSKGQASPRPTEVSVKTGHAKSHEVGSPRSAVVSPSGLKPSLRSATFHPSHTCRRHALVMAAGIGCAVLAIIVMTLGVIPWRDKWHDATTESCSLPFAGGSTCFTSGETTLCYEDPLTVAGSKSGSLSVSKVCAIQGGALDASLRSDGSRNAIKVAQGVADLAACKALASPAAGSYSAASAVTLSVRCLFSSDASSVNLDPNLSSHAYSTFVFCVIVFCLFALGSLAFFIPLYLMLHERVAWYVCTPAPGSASRGSRMKSFSACWLLLLALLFVPLLIFYVVFFVIVAIGEVRYLILAMNIVVLLVAVIVSLFSSGAAVLSLRLSRCVSDVKHQCSVLGSSFSR